MRTNIDIDDDTLEAATRADRDFDAFADLRGMHAWQH